MSKKFALAGLVLAFCVSGQAGVQYTFNVNTTIPDNSSFGLTDSHTLTGLGTSISDVLLSVVLSGNPGDLSDLTTAYIRLGNSTGSPSINLTPVTTESLSFHLTSFQTLNPNDTWTIFFADTVPTGVTTLNSWSLDITPVPEPINVALICFGVLAALIKLISWRRQASRTAPAP